MTDTDRTFVIIDGLAATWFASCVAASIALIAPAIAIPGGLLLSVCGAALGGWFAFNGLRQIDSRRPLPLRSFPFPYVTWVSDADEELLLTPDLIHRPSRPEAPVGELILTLEERLGVTSEMAEPVAEELILDDVLAELAPDSRVVRLFDPAAMPTAGELHSRIDRHLQAQQSRPTPDAAQALNDALTDLRRSLR